MSAQHTVGDSLLPTLVRITAMSPNRSISTSSYRIRALPRTKDSTMPRKLQKKASLASGRLAPKGIYFENRPYIHGSPLTRGETTKMLYFASLLSILVLLEYSAASLVSQRRSSEHSFKGTFRGFLLLAFCSYLRFWTSASNQPAFVDPSSSLRSPPCFFGWPKGVPDSIEYS